MILKINWHILNIQNVKLTNMLKNSLTLIVRSAAMVIYCTISENFDGLDPSFDLICK